MLIHHFVLVDLILYVLCANMVSVSMVLPICFDCVIPLFTSSSRRRGGSWKGGCIKELFSYMLSFHCSLTFPSIYLSLCCYLFNIFYIDSGELFLEFSRNFVYLLNQTKQILQLRMIWGFTHQRAWLLKQKLPLKKVWWLTLCLCLILVGRDWDQQL